MPTTSHHENIAATADTVWSLVSVFGDNSWHNLEVTCEGGDGLGAVRKVTMPTGVVTELCEVHDAATRTVGYTILDNNPFPATDYHGLIEITPVDDASCELTWSARYETEADPEQLGADLARFLKGAARALKRHAEQAA
ncbi:MAG: SRPBCC family protein [Actinobacteria bacterium]|nr:SRPBCC family protein [Actinomycetota bacterium]